MNQDDKDSIGGGRTPKFQENPGGLMDEEDSTLKSGTFESEQSSKTTTNIAQVDDRWISPKNILYLIFVMLFIVMVVAMKSHYQINSAKDHERDVADFKDKPTYPTDLHHLNNHSPNQDPGDPSRNPSMKEGNDSPTKHEEQPEKYNQDHSEKENQDHSEKENQDKPEKDNQDKTEKDNQDKPETPGTEKVPGFPDKRIDDVPGFPGKRSDEDGGHPVSHEGTTYHLIPHSHWDLGWIATEQSVFEANVMTILNSMLEYLTLNKFAKFHLADFGFVYMYLSRKPESAEKLKQLVKEGRLELINGGYVLNDHATVTFDDMLANYQYGRKFIKQNFDHFPKTIWAIDQFGLSLAATRIAEQLGYKDQVLNRVPNPTKMIMKEKGDMLFDWQTPNSKDAGVRTLVMSSHYETMGMMAYDTGVWGYRPCPEFNILSPVFKGNEPVDDQLKQIAKFKAYYKTSNVFIPFGGDFHYQSFEVTYRSPMFFEIFIKSNNLSGRYANVNVQISTVSEYFAAVEKEEKDVKLNYTTVESKDFFPLVEFAYNTNNRAAWTGYFTTYPYAKKFLRSFGELYRGLRSYLATKIPAASLDDPISSIINKTRESEWIHAANQHHDTMTGTSKDFVMNHYHYRQQANTLQTRLVWKAMITKVVTAQFDSNAVNTFDADVANKQSYQGSVDSYFRDRIDFYYRYDENKSIHESGWDLEFAAPVDESFNLKAGSRYLILGQAYNGDRALRFSSQNLLKSVTLTRASGQTENVLFTTSIRPQLKTQIGGQTEPTVYEYTANVNMDMFEHAILTSSDERNRKLPADIKINKEDDYSEAGLRFSFTDDGALSIDNTNDKRSLEIGIYLYKFNSSNYTTSSTEKDSTDGIYMENGLHTPGKYIFTTTSQEPDLLQPDSATYRVMDGKGVAISMVFESLGCTAQFTYSLFMPDHEKYSTKVFCKPLRTGSFDAVVRYKTDIKNDKTFYTDSNGLYAMKRTRGENGPYIECNYYPVTRFANIEDNKSRLSVMVDRAEGATSPAEGVIEVMIFRRTDTDDQRGVAEPNYEPQDVNLIHRLLFEDLTSTDQLAYRRCQIEMDTVPVIVELIPYVSDMQFKLEPYQRPQIDLPDTVRLFIDSLEDGTVYIRLYNMHERKSHSLNIVKVARGIFTGQTVSGVQEVPIDFNGELDGGRPAASTDMTDLMFDSMAIRAFRVDFA